MRWVKEKEYLEDSMANKTHIRGRKYVKDGEVARKKQKIMLEWRKVLVEN